MAKPDPYGDIDFEEINDATGLAPDEIKCLKVQEPYKQPKSKGIITPYAFDTLQFQGLVAIAFPN